MRHNQNTPSLDPINNKLSRDPRTQLDSKRITVYCFTIGLVIFLSIFYHHHRGSKPKAVVGQTIPLKITATYLKTLTPGEHTLISARGYYLKNFNLLLLKKYHHFAGYDVITPLEISVGHRLLLVDRGWRPQSQSSLLSHQPSIPVPYNSPHLATLIGYSHYPLSATFLLPNIILARRESIIVRAVPFHFLKLQFKQPILPFILQLDSQQPDGFIRSG